MALDCYPTENAADLVLIYKKSDSGRPPYGQESSEQIPEIVVSSKQATKWVSIAAAKDRLR